MNKQTIIAVIIITILAAAGICVWFVLQQTSVETNLPVNVSLSPSPSHSQSPSPSPSVMETDSPEAINQDLNKVDTGDLNKDFQEVDKDINSL